MGTLTGKVAFITGAARGQGRSHAMRLAEEGASIIAVDLCGDIPTVPYALGSEEDLAITVKEVEVTGSRIVAIQADVRDQAALGAALDKGLDAFGRLDIVLANAGIAPMSVNEDDRQGIWRDVVDVNLTGVWNTMEVTVPKLVEAGNGGAVVLTSSTAGLKAQSAGTLGGLAYTAAKHGVVGIMRCLAKDLAPHSIRVNSVHPTGVATPMIMNETIGELFAAKPELAQTLANPMPVPVVEPIDISNAIAWLVSDAARYVTGITLPVDAGFMVQ
ncbi:3-oxoacyl-(acyl-carrier-protein) reductase [Mycolicibacterium rhodesiae JS60]|nr:3-oxoacyl-(acyl-carrier-protein) reductase [Mycolicibacterium rhodesiae JS60]